MTDTIEPTYRNPLVELYTGDCREVLRALPADHFHCVVTSPPYWGLRSYGVGAENGEIGSEPTPEAYVETMVEVFREVRRVMREDATVWLNLGDSYASGKGTCYNPGGGENSLGQERKAAGAYPLDRGNVSTLRESGLKPKDLCMIPARVALALQADGWWIRSDIIWSKPNSMPESVTDRPTKAHEYVFLLSKSARYYYDAEAIRDPAAESTQARAYLGKRPETPKTLAMRANGMQGAGDTLGVYDRPFRNRRTVWTIPTGQFPGAHYATFPTALVEPCVLAGTSARGCCSAKITKLKVRDNLTEVEQAKVRRYLESKGLL